jgi:arsenite methyltransferase
LNDFNTFIDDLPLWSAPFGLRLLDCLKIKRNVNVLDIGCGEGFPIIEIAARFGKTGNFFGLDPLRKPLKRMAFKKELYQLPTVQAVQAYAEFLPFKTSHFDLIVSNNGMNNLTNLKQTLKECRRTIKPSGQMVIAVNSEQTMKEFYALFQTILEEITNQAKGKIDSQIQSKRRSEKEWLTLLKASGFGVKTILNDQFIMSFLDGTALMDHYLIRHFFLPGWKSLVEARKRSAVFQQIESELNKVALEKGQVSLTIPYIVLDCQAE